MKATWWVVQNPRKPEKTKNQKNPRKPEKPEKPKNLAFGSDGSPTNKISTVTYIIIITS
jgi:hypothetical protein